MQGRPSKCQQIDHSRYRKYMLVSVLESWSLLSYEALWVILEKSDYSMRSFSII